MEKALEERIAGIEVAIRYQGEQIYEIKKLIQELRNEIAQRQVENGVQTATLTRHDEDLQRIWERIEDLDHKTRSNARFIYIGIGILSAVTFILQLIPRG